MLLALAVAAAAPPAAAPVAPDSDTVVITATLPQLLRALEQCKRGGCTPRQDAIASIRYAEAAFRSGRYSEARRVLQAAIARDKGAAKSDPNAVAALYEATETAALHDGDQDVAKRAGFDRARLLREAHSQGSTDALVAELDTVDLIFHAGRLDEAVSRYGIIAHRAAAAHQPEVAAAATLRQAGAEHMLHRDRAARDLLKPVIADETLPSPYRIAARALTARVASDRGDKQAVDALIATVVQSGVQGLDGSGPMLLWQPPLPNPADPANLNRFNLTDQAAQLNDVGGVEWADIGFTVKSDGTVDAPEVLRGSKGQGWARPILAMIAQRRYTPLAKGAVTPYRIERWTLTADYAVAPESLVRRRSGINPHYEQSDLTPAAPPPARS